MAASLQPPSLSSHILCVPQISSCFTLVRILVTGFRVHQKIQDYFISRPLITSEKILSPKKVTFTGSGVRMCP